MRIKRKGIRPNEPLSPEMCARIAQLTFNGFNQEEVALALHLSFRQVREYYDGAVAGPEIKRAVIELKNEAIERVKAGKGKLVGLMWFLERRFPRQFAPPALQLSLAAGPVTNNTLVISAEAAKEYMARSKDALHEIDQLIKERAPQIASDAE